MTAELAAELAGQAWVGSVRTSNRYLTVTATPEALERVAVEIVEAGPGCVTSDALRGRTIRQPAGKRPELTARLAAAAGAHLADELAGERVTELTDEHENETARVPSGSSPGRYDEIAAYAGPDVARFALARARPGREETGLPDPRIIARHVLDNPAYAVRYAHAAAVAVLRWAGTQPGDFRPRRLTAPGELALLDTLSWLPERVAAAARRGRPDEFARYLEILASRIIDVVSTPSYSPSAESVPSERLWLADAARTGLAAGLGLLGVSAPDRL